MRALASLVLLLALAAPALLPAKEVSGTRPLLTVKSGEWQSALPSDTHFLNDPEPIEQFLATLDGAPPDWTAIYGNGHHDAGLDDRLFNLNRARDAQRHGKGALKRRITFLWPGELSEYDMKAGGFRVAIGPTAIPTRWGLVRFKADDLPANLVAVPPPEAKRTLRQRIEQAHQVEVTVALTGRLIAEESLIYDFSHEDPGRGVIMPVVRIEQIDFMLVRAPP